MKICGDRALTCIKHREMKKIMKRERIEMIPIFFTSNILREPLCAVIIKSNDSNFFLS